MRAGHRSTFLDTFSCARPSFICGAQDVCAHVAQVLTFRERGSGNFHGFADKLERRDGRSVLQVDFSQAERFDQVTLVRD
jgi:hypothetical protein